MSHTRFNITYIFTIKPFTVPRASYTLNVFVWIQATPAATPEPTCRSEQEVDQPQSRPESKAESKPEDSEGEREERTPETGCNEEKVDLEASEEEKEEQTTREKVLGEIEKEMADLASKVDKEKIKELVSTEINLEKQLENVQRQLLALKQLPSEIESHLRIVSDQLQKIMELSGVQNGATSNGEGRRGGFAIC